MSEETQTTTVPVPETEEKTQPTKKLFTRKGVKKHIELSVHLPRVFPDYEPWGFKFRIALSKDAEERRQEYLSLAPSEQTIKGDEQALDEVCDLLVELPTGFGDLEDTGNGPGKSFKAYVNSTSDPAAKDMLMKIVTGANVLYWRSIMPQEFRTQI